MRAKTLRNLGADLAKKEAEKSELYWRHGCVALNQTGDIVAKAYNSHSLLRYGKQREKCA